MRCIHYERSTGLVVQASQASQPFEREGFGVAVLHDSHPELEIGNKRYAVDLASVQLGELGWDYCMLIELPSEPPSVDEIRLQRNAELAATDVFMVPDRPMNESLRDQWRAYRQALRDLGEQQAAADMIRAWPVRPDGFDLIKNLRSE